MIELRHVSKRYRAGKGWATAMTDLSLRVELGDRIAILGPSASGKTTALRLVNGRDEASTGTVTREMRASWIVPQSSYFSGAISTVANIRFIARLYRFPQRRFVERVIDFSEVGELAGAKLSTLTGQMRNQLCYAMALCADFDVYLFDEGVGTGSVDFREKCSLAIKRLANTRSIIIATTSTAVAKEYCDQAYVLNNGVSTYYSDMDEACSVFEAVKASAKAEREDKAEPLASETSPTDDAFEFL